MSNTVRMSQHNVYSNLLHAPQPGLARLLLLAEMMEHIPLTSLELSQSKSPLLS
jgi:hypothetical protein